MTAFSDIVQCGACGHVLGFGGEATDVQCACGASGYRLRGGVFAARNHALRRNPEVGVRDAQADGYLWHSKFPTQVSRLQEWIGQLPEALRGLPVLDLGCGPGPSTRLLLEHGYRPLAVDFSLRSLSLNRDLCGDAAERAVFVQADLNTIRFQPGTVGLVILADVLQHVGSRANRERLLHTSCGALVPGGKFFVSFFNLNIKHYLKGDVHGDFAAGRIQYERLSAENVAAHLPAFVRVEGAYAMNIVSRPGWDRRLARLPLAWLFARMGVIHGCKQDA